MPILIRSLAQVPDNLTRPAQTTLSSARVPACLTKRAAKTRSSGATRGVKIRRAEIRSSVRARGRKTRRAGIIPFSTLKQVKQIQQVLIMLSSVGMQALIPTTVVLTLFSALGRVITTGVAGRTPFLAIQRVIFSLPVFLILFWDLPPIIISERV